VIDLSEGPMVIEQPSDGSAPSTTCGSWIIDVGGPGPDRGLGGKYLIVGPDYDGPLPEGGYFVAHSKTNRVLYASRAYLVDDDPKPGGRERQGEHEDLPLCRGRLRHQHRAGADRCGSPGAGAEDPRDTLHRGQRGLAFNTIPPSDFGFFEWINENVQAEPATSYDVELAGQLAAIGIVKGKDSRPTSG
jgi:hypothetical protein